MSARAPERTPDRTGGGAPPMIHLYPKDPVYRKSGMSPPQPGDIARCGYVKDTPPVFPRPTRVDCVVCSELSKREGRHP